MNEIRCYSELIKLPTFEERFRYLSLGGQVGKETFGFDRYVNQRFYRSREWKQIRDLIIVRDSGCDLGIKDRLITGRLIVHHMNPILLTDINCNTEFLLNPEYLICTENNTHQAIHYGDESLLTIVIPERTKNDTCPWKH